VIGHTADVVAVAAFTRTQRLRACSLGIVLIHIVWFIVKVVHAVTLG